mmetsp:Transcript_80736/g.249045  ORF Transcript_80736/g.249045 Transcript_80736/m.249045 type:complete len:142 (-) Transcript_80736:43-468(-)
MAAGTLTVRSVSGKEVSMELPEDCPVNLLRQQLATALGVTQAVRGVQYQGRVLASDPAVADVLGLSADDVVRPPHAFKGKRASSMLNVWDLGATVSLGEYQALSPPEEGERRHAPDVWEVDAIGCLVTPEGQGYIFFGRDR